VRRLAATQAWRSRVRGERTAAGASFAKSAGLGVGNKIWDCALRNIPGVCVASIPPDGGLAADAVDA
jgi:hypothetical protein